MNAGAELGQGNEIQGNRECFGFGPFLDHFSLHLSIPGVSSSSSCSPCLVFDYFVVVVLHSSSSSGYLIIIIREAIEDELATARVKLIYTKRKTLVMII